MSMSIRLPKNLLLILSSVILGFALLFTPLLKAEASVSWGQEVVEVGKRYIGTKFKWAGNTPKAGFDASGYTQYIFKTSAAKMNLPHSSKGQYQLGKSVEKSQLKQGDLVFFNTDGKGISFVGIYDGNGNFLAATSKGVKYQSLNTKYWKDRYVGAKRILKE
ncbi:C40 family peptidase [Niallia endozanthoxylica]|uniref:NlpC/P60 family protein n=1 Tax=Niallia endozanthoxylica TaxID=2036016 RepID=A0A5J5HQ14_9BACI|nr:C40 family peptidase [Niallia endozanthoxylica]KAA9023872.1 NlpC/P60 family protein [Niallia endozanthoxylica]